MMWKKCEICKMEKVEDYLGNLTPDAVIPIVETKARFTPWTDEQISVYGDVTKTEQQFLLPIPREKIEGAEIAIMDWHIYDITDVQQLSPRFTIIRVKGYKQ